MIPPTRSTEVNYSIETQSNSIQKISTVISVNHYSARNMILFSYQRLIMQRLTPFVLSLLCLLHPAMSYSQACGSLSNSFGPFDYTDPSSYETGLNGSSDSRLSVVERFHFFPEVENLIQAPGPAFANLDYTLRAFPNHHRALYAVSKLERQLDGKLPTKQLKGYPRSVDCYFTRAKQFKPDDPTIYLLHGIHLHTLGRHEDALTQYKSSEQLYPNSADLQYNIGLLYFELGQFELAKAHAQKAYQLGHKQLGLLNKLKQAGHWP